MSFAINQKKDFSIKRKSFAGNLKPNKVAARKVTDSAAGHAPARSGSFGNTNT